MRPSFHDARTIGVISSLRLLFCRNGQGPIGFFAMQPAGDGHCYNHFVSRKEIRLHNACSLVFEFGLAAFGLRSTILLLNLEISPLT